MTKSLIDVAREYLESQKGFWPQICEETDLDYSWLCKFAARKINNPTVRKIETLLEHKSKHRPRKKRGRA